jgi:hypothetical protein
MTHRVGSAVLLTLLGSLSGVPALNAAGAPARLDFNADGYADLVYQTQVQIWPNPPSDHQIRARTSSGSDGLLWSWPANGSPGREVLIARDFSGDGKGDVIWNVNGQYELWVMNGVTIRRQVPLPPTDGSWDLRGAGDFDGDARTDILWQDPQNGLHMWLFRRPGFVESLDLGVLQLPWQVAGVADFNGDGRADVLLRNTSTGTLYEWQMNGAVISAHGPVSPTLDLNWAVRATYDFDGDGKADILWWSTQNWTDSRVWNMSGFQATATFGLPRVDPEAIDDFDGNGRAEVMRTVGVIPTPGFGCDLTLTGYYELVPGGPSGGGGAPPNLCVGVVYLQPGVY